MVITVEEGQSIQGAIDAAAPGDTIVVQEGVFREHLVIGPGKDQLRVVGAGPGQTILDGTGLGELIGLTIEEAGHVTVSGITLRHFGSHGVIVESSDGVLREIEVTQCGGCGISLTGARNLVKAAHVHANGVHGVAIRSGMYNYVIGGRILANGAAGVLIEQNSSGSLVLETEVCANGKSGICLHSNGCWLIGNRLRENHGDGIEAQGVADLLLYGNTSSENRKTGLVGGIQGFVAAHNQLSHNDGDGLAVRSGDAAVGLSQALLYKNDLSANAATGLDGTGSTCQTVLYRNAADDNGGMGLNLPGSRFNRIVGNSVTRNKKSGVHLSEQPSGNLIDGNTLSENQGDGIHLDPTARQNAVRGNRSVANTSFDLVAEPVSDDGNVFDQNACEKSSPTELCG